MTRLLLPLIALTLLVAGCGEKSDSSSAGSGKTEKLTVMLDWFPNADHAGLYAAQQSGEYKRAGLDVKFVTPSDAASPLKLLQAGRVDLAVSYQPDVLLARDQGADVVAVGALVQKPLTSLMSLGNKGITDPKQLAGKTAFLVTCRVYSSDHDRTAWWPSMKASSGNQLRPSRTRAPVLRRSLKSD